MAVCALVKGAHISNTRWRMEELRIKCQKAFQKGDLTLSTQALCLSPFLLSTKPLCDDANSQILKCLYSLVAEGVNILPIIE